MKANTILSGLLAFAVFAAGPLLAADKKKAWTDPKQAKKEDPDFALQGEYVAGGSPALGAQVVALGSGKFDAYLLEGGLPGAGWTPDQKRTRLSGSLADGAVEFGEQDGVTAKLSGEGLAVTKGGKTVKLARTVRKSPTVGMKPPKGAVVLFGGKDKDAGNWKNGKVVDGLLAASNALSHQGFKDCTIHIEFRCPYMPHARGQGRGNSGVYYGGRWETQVLDSFGLTGEMNECGGVYSIAKPELNMCLPPLTWQTYDVEYTHPKFDESGKRTAWPRMTVKLNGVVVHDDIELNKTHTTAAPVNGALKDEGSPIFLQNHGNPVFYRNIWVLEKK